MLLAIMSKKPSQCAAKIKPGSPPNFHGPSGKGISSLNHTFQSRPRKCVVAIVQLKPMTLRVLSS